MAKIAVTEPAIDYYAKAHEKALQRYQGNGSVDDEQADSDLTDSYSHGDAFSVSEKDASRTSDQAHSIPQYPVVYDDGDENSPAPCPTQVNSGRPFSSVSRHNYTRNTYQSHSHYQQDQEISQRMSQTTGYDDLELYEQSQNNYFSKGLLSSPRYDEEAFDDMQIPARFGQLYSQAPEYDMDQMSPDTFPTTPLQDSYHVRSPQYPTYRADSLAAPESSFGDFSNEMGDESPLPGPAKLSKAKARGQPHPSVMEIDEGYDDNIAHSAMSDEDLFVREKSPPSHFNPPNRVQKKPGNDKEVKIEKRGRGRPNSTGIPGAPVWKSSRAMLYSSLKAQKESNRDETPQSQVSTHSGRLPRWDTHVDPPLVDAKDVSAAFLKKRNLPTNTNSKKVSLKQTGANDPENIDIVNMKDVEGKTFAEIAKVVNQKRINNGKRPNQSANSVNCRYNRTAPQLYQVQGLAFIRIADRANAKGEHKYTKDEEDLFWDLEMDMLLVDVVQDYDQSKWEQVALRFNEKVGYGFATATEVAQRHSHL